MIHPKWLSPERGSRSWVVAVLKDFFRGDFQHEAHLVGLAVGVFLLSKVALKEFFEVKICPFFGDFGDATTNADGSLPVGGRVDDAYHDAGIELDVASLLMAFDGVDENV